MTEPNLPTKLILSTVRLQTDSSVGTGFFYKMREQSNGDFKAVIVTNRHVLEGADTLEITLRCKFKGEILNKVFSITSLQGNVTFHPNTEIDLAALAIPGLFNQMFSIGLEPEVYFLDESAIPTDEEVNSLSPIEDVIVIGYPNGLWDKVNVKPLVRRGITASDFKLDYEGEPKFIIDSAIFPGSSGSPVFLYNKGTYDTGNGDIVLGGLRVKLLGINSSVFIQGIQGDLIESEVPTELISMSRMPIGLGIIIKASQLKEIEPLLPL